MILLPSTMQTVDKSKDVMQAAVSRKSNDGTPLHASEPSQNQLNKNRATVLKWLRDYIWRAHDESIKSALSKQSNLVLSLMEAYQLDERTRKLFVHWLVAEQHSAIEATLELYSEEMDRLETSVRLATQKHDEKYGKSREGLLADLVIREYRKNRRLNKFEQKTDKQVQKVVEQRLDDEWVTHCSQLSDLESEICQYENEIRRLKDKLEVLEILQLIIRANKYDETSGLHNDCCVDYSDDTLVGSRSTGDVCDQIVEVLSHPIHAETVSPTDALLANIDHALHNLSFSRESVTAIKKSCIVVAMPTTAEATKLRSVPRDSNDISSQQDDELNPRRSDKTVVPVPEDSSMFVSKPEYEYEHNGDRTPTVSLPTSKRKPANNPFAGLDRYARELFSRSPESGSPKLNDGGFIERCNIR